MLKSMHEPWICWLQRVLHAVFYLFLPRLSLMPPQLPCSFFCLQSLKQSRFRQLCSYGRYAYRWTALTYSALQMYQNPWLVQAVCTALWTFSRLGMLGLRAFMA